MKKKSRKSRLSVYLMGLATCTSAYFFIPLDGSSLAEENREEKKIKETVKSRNMKFDLLDPELAPDPIKEQVMLGYNVIIETKKYAKGFTGNDLDCNNCHFCGGNTLGGKNGGISLVGVTNVYPRYSARSKKTISLKERIFNCFQRSMNGKSPDPNHPIMQGIIAYLSWISMEVASDKDPSWLGLTPLKNPHKPNSLNGAKVYLAHCAICHQPLGTGTQGVPPLWGNGSYNDGAGMNTLPMLSSFVYYNMPYENPVLSEEEALDVAAFLIEQSRPVFKPKPQKQLSVIEKKQ